MSTVHELLRRMVARHVDTAPLPDIVALASALLGDKPSVEIPRNLSTAAGRFVRVDANKEIGWAEEIPDSAWWATWDRETGLVWSHVLGDAENGQSWEKSCQLAQAHTLFGVTFDAPDIRQLLSIIDYERFDPAVDPDYFRGPYGWHWSKTPAKAPAACAWYVLLGSGYATRGRRSSRAHVRAVCASQSLGLR